MPKWKLVLPTGLLWLVGVFWGIHSLLEQSGCRTSHASNLPAAQFTAPDKPTLFIMVDPKLTGCAGFRREAENVRN
jgi:hypothetical protein